MPTNKLLAVGVSVIRATDFFENYREASRHLRNIYYVPKGESAWDVLGDFEKTSELLFKHLVCAPLNIAYDKYDWLNEPVPFFESKAVGSRLPIKINRNPNVDHGAWDHDITFVEANDFTLNFICYFDWCPEGVVDNRYIMCKISNASKSKSVIGHYALVESHHVEIHCGEYS